MILASWNRAETILISSQANPVVEGLGGLPYTLTLTAAQPALEAGYI